MATGQLMFEVGVSENVKNLEKVKEQLNSLVENYSKNKAIQLKVEIENLDAINTALSKIGDSPKLRELRQEIESLNREFSKLAAGAGGVGDLNLRAANQNVAELKENWQSANRTLLRYKTDLEDLRRSRDMQPVGSQARADYQGQIATFKKTVEEQQKIADAAKSAYDKAVKDAGQLVDANTRAEASYRELKSSIDSLKTLSNGNVVGTDFANWAREVQSVTASVRELVEQLQKMHNASTTALQATQQLSQAEQKGTPQGGLFDPQKFTTLQEAIDKIISEINRLQQAFTKLGENSSLSNLTTMINGLAVTLSSLSNAIKIQPLDEQVKTLLERCEKAEAKLREVGDAAKYLNERAGAKTQQKAGTIMDITGTEAEQLNKVSSTAERFARLLVEIENQMAKIGKIQATGAETTILKNAQERFEALKKLVDSTIKGKPIAEGLFIPASDSQLAQFIQQFGLLKAEYRDIIKEADRFNKINEKDSLKQKNEELRAAASNMKEAANESRRLKETISNLEALASKAGALGVDPSKIQDVINRLKSFREEFINLSKTGQFSPKMFTSSESFFKLKRDIKDVARDIKKEMSAALKPDTEQANAFKEYASVLRQISSLVKTIYAADKLGIDSTQLRGMTDQLVVYAQTLERIARAGGVGFTSWRQSNEGISYLRLRTDASNKQALLNAEVADAKRTNTLATNQLTTSEQQLSNAIKGSTDSMRGQSQVLSDLKMLATQYLSVWGAQSFMNSIIETGGQLEQQRLSLSAILGDMEKANTLFGQVKELALKSPFGVVQIDQMTKQLAAYSFEYEELFGWTKRLADISAATGTSVDRLALALGHVRSEGALSGYTLRQFAMANVPVLRMLSENLGISSKEVRERVRKKEIGADDVQEILKQLTDEGGMFYNAQEVMSQALNAKFKNLRDAFDIMYGEIAEGGVGDALKELANILTQGAKEWERYGKDMLAVGAAVGIGRAAMVLYNTALGENTASTLKSIAAAQQKENANLRLARAAGIVTKAEYEQLIYNERYSVSGLKIALVENKLTIEELQRAVALGKVNKAVAQAAVVAAGYDAALISNVKVLGFWRKGIFLLGEGFRAAAVAVKGFLASVWPLLALTAVFDLVNKTSQSNDAAVEAAEGAAKATNKYQDLQAMTERLGTSQNKTTDQLENNIKAMKEGLIAVGKYTDELKKQVESVETLAEKYDILHAAMKKVSDEANDKQSRKQNLIEEGLSAGGGTAWNPLNWFRDNALQDAKDIDNYTEKLYLALDKNDRVLRDGFRKILETKKLWQKKFESMSAKDVFMSLDESVQNDVLYALRWGNNSTKEMQSAGRSLASVLYGSGGKELKDAIGYSYKGAIEELRGHKDELAKAFADAFQVDHPEIDLSKADKDQKIIFAKWLDTTIANLNDVKEAGKKALNDIVIEGAISVRPVYSLDNENWSKFIEDFKEKNPLAYYEWNKHESTGALTEEEKRKSLESYGKTFSGVTQNTLGNAAKKQIKELQEERKRLVDFEKSIVYNDSEEARQNTEKRKKEIDKEINRLKQAQKDYNQYGDPDKNKGRGEDKEAKELRERVRILKEAETSYQYWRKAVGEAASAFHVNDEFGKILFEQGFSFTDVEKYTKTLEELRAKYQSIYDTSEKAGKKRPQLLEAIKEIDKILSDIGRKDFERDTERFLSQTQIQLDSLTRAWDTFNSVREATGNIELAKQLSGVTYDEDNIRNLAEATRSKIEADFAAAGAVTIPLSINLSDKQIEDKVHKAFADAAPKRKDFEEGEKGLEAYNRALMQHETHIKGVIEETKKLRDLQRDLYKKDIDVFTKAWNDDRDRYQQFTKAVERYKTESQSLKRLLDEWNSGEVDEYGNRKGISQEQYDRAFANLTSRESWAKFKAENGMDWLTSNIDKTSITTVRKMIDALKDYAETTQMSSEETEAWFKAINMFTDREAVISPIEGVTQAIENYNRAAKRRIAAETSYNNIKANPSATPQQIAEASQKYDEAVAAEIAAFESLKKAINVLSSKFTKFGDDLKNFGEQLGGTVGDIFGGFGQIFSSVGNGMNAIQNIDFGATGIFKVMGYAQTAMTLASSMIGVFQGIESMIPSTDQLYEKYAAKQKKINQMREAVDNYRIAVARARAEEEGWIGGGDALNNLRKAYDVHGEVVLAYYNKLNEAQEQYVESSAGIKKAIIPMIAAITAVAAVAAGVFTGGTGTVALWGLGSMAMGALGAGAIATTLSATTLAAIGAAVAASAGAIVGKAVQAGIDAISYDNGKIDARHNMKVQTQHRTFFRGEKTQNLEEWTKENLGLDLFDKSGLIDLKAAQAVLDSGATLVGETKETLEKLMELREQYDEWEKSIRDYVSDRFGGIADDMVNAIWDWLSDGENALDKFHEYASDTFRQIAQDAVKSFLKITVLDKFQEQLENMYKAYSMKDKNGNRVLNEQGLMLGVASLAGEMSDAFEAALPMAENLATIIKDAFDIQGFDITNKDSSSSSTGKSIQSITEQTADLLVSYANACRADLSVIRTLDSKAVQEYWPSQIRLMTSGTQSLTNIEQHTLAIMRSNNVIAERITNLDNNINGLKSKTWSVPVG